VVGSVIEIEFYNKPTTCDPMPVDHGSDETREQICSVSWTLLSVNFESISGHDIAAWFAASLVSACVEHRSE
jgi:hypothetical protein